MTEHPNVIDIITKRQQARAQREQHTLDKDGYCGCGDGNISQGLSDAAGQDSASVVAAKLASRASAAAFTGGACG